MNFPECCCNLPGGCRAVHRDIFMVDAGAQAATNHGTMRQVVQTGVPRRPRAAGRLNECAARMARAGGASCGLEKRRGRPPLRGRVFRGQAGIGRAPRCFMQWQETCLSAVVAAKQRCRRFLVDQKAMHAIAMQAIWTRSRPARTSAITLSLRGIVSRLRPATGRPSAGASKIGMLSTDQGRAPLRHPDRPGDAPGWQRSAG